VTTDDAVNNRMKSAQCERSQELYKRPWLCWAPLLPQPMQTHEPFQQTPARKHTGICRRCCCPAPAFAPQQAAARLYARTVCTPHTGLSNTHLQV
jgi:hypothetical protein